MILPIELRTPVGKRNFGHPFCNLYILHEGARGKLIINGDTVVDISQIDLLEDAEIRSIKWHLDDLGALGAVYLFLSDSYLKLSNMRVRVEESNIAYYDYAVLQSADYSRALAFPHLKGAYAGSFTLLGVPSWEKILNKTNYTVFLFDKPLIRLPDKRHSISLDVEDTTEYGGTYTSGGLKELLTLDYGEVHTFDFISVFKIYIKPGSDTFPNLFKIQVSKDGQTFEDIFTHKVTDTNGETIEGALLFEGITARFIRYVADIQLLDENHEATASLQVFKHLLWRLDP